MTKQGIIFFILFFWLPLFAWSQDTAITLRELEQEALANNPEIRMVHARTEAAGETATLAAAMPDPMIGAAIRNIGWFNNITVGEEPMSQAGIMLTQEIPFPGKLATMGRAARHKAEQEGEMERETRLRVLSSIRAAYYDYYLAWRSAEILEQNKEIMKNFQRVAETRYATGQGIQQDVIRAQLEVSMLIEKIAMEEQKKESQRATLNSLAGRDPAASLGRPADRPSAQFGRDYGELTEQARLHSPLIRAKERMVQQGEQELSLSRREFLPDMVFSAGWFDRGDMTDMWEASIMFKVPLYFWNKSTGVRAAKSALWAARYDHEASKLMVAAKMKNLHTMAATSERLLRLYEAAILPQARLAIQSAMTSYQVGKVDFLALLESQTLLLRYQIAYEQEMVNLNKTVSMIVEIAGHEGIESNEN
ncbi:MAG: hypothetical protein A2X56_14515 [Nitrospirae bacterium GWC2_57_13]|jgi:outer membrane protein, heavy metal efflux system|nr:MAG: hypothetical protein A2X56_14515 [Nitrospirae bacterium GWC2_57_13]OGW42685.1 MAG: hypothetical protein A2X57_08650 [Nitrospirae bacterium GWD2_57_8]